MQADPDTRTPWPQGRGAAFCTTCWTVVLAAGQSRGPGGTDAFARLYLDYWTPLYSYLRRRGFTQAQAEDIAQDFFTSLMEKDRLAHLEKSGGRFRSFLLAALNHFLINRWDHERAGKRGGGTQPISLDVADGERAYGLWAAETDTPETLFERQWVSTLLENVLDRLRKECEAAGKEALFADLKLRLQGDSQGLPHQVVAARHGMSEGALKVAVHRLRRRYGELLRAEIALTVSTEAEVEEELRHLIRVVNR